MTGKRPLLAVFAVLMTSACNRPGPPARLVAGNADTVVVSSRRPVHIPLRAYDARGRQVRVAKVRYHWQSGLDIPVSAYGIVSCSRAGEALVRASLGALTSTVIVICSPIRELRSLGSIELVVGDSASAIPVQAIGLDGRPAALMAGTVSVGDSSIARIEGMRVRPRRPGSTGISVRIGDFGATMFANVYQPVATFDGLMPEQHEVAMRVRLANGEFRHWRIASGQFVVVMLSDATGRRAPRLAVTNANCTRVPFGTDQSLFCLAKSEAVVIAFDPWRANHRADASGTLALRRVSD